MTVHRVDAASCQGSIRRWLMREPLAAREPDPTPFACGRQAITDEGTAQPRAQIKWMLRPSIRLWRNLDQPVARRVGSGPGTVIHIFVIRASTPDVDNAAANRLLRSRQRIGLRGLRVVSADPLTAALVGVRQPDGSEGIRGRCRHP